MLNSISREMNCLVAGKHLLLFFSIMIITISVNSQTIIPHSYFRKSISKIDSAENKTISVGSNSPAPFRFFPSIKQKNYFESEGPDFFQNNIISYNDSLSNIALYSELASDYIGPVRISAGVTLAYPKSDTNTVQQQNLNRQKFVQRFSTGGGALVFNFALPVFVYTSKLFGTAMSFGPRFSLDPPSFGVTSGQFAHNTALGADLQAEIRGVRGVIKFFGNTRVSYVAGNSAFYNAIELTGRNRKGFTFNNYMIGVNVKDIFTISYTKYWGSKSVSDRLSEFLSFTVEPNFKD